MIKLTKAKPNKFVSDFLNQHGIDSENLPAIYIVHGSMTVGGYPAYSCFVGSPGGIVEITTDGGKDIDLKVDNVPAIFISKNECDNNRLMMDTCAIHEIAHATDGVAGVDPKSQDYGDSPTEKIAREHEKEFLEFIGIHPEIVQCMMQEKYMTP